MCVDAWGGTQCSLATKRVVVLDSSLSRPQHSERPVCVAMVNWHNDTVRLHPHDRLRLPPHGLVVKPACALVHPHRLLPMDPTEPRRLQHPLRSASYLMDLSGRAAAMVRAKRQNAVRPTHVAIVPSGTSFVKKKLERAVHFRACCTCFRLAHGHRSAFVPLASSLERTQTKPM